MVLGIKEAKEVDIVSEKSYPIEATKFIKENLNVE